MLTDIIKKCVTPPLEWFGEHFPVALVRLRYLARFHKLPNFKNPKNLNEKILYQKLFTDTSEWTRLADKYRVRDYVRECGLEDILVPLYGAWERVEDIPFDTLPDRFILKANNGDGKGTNLKIEKAKMNDEDWARLRETLREWLSRKHIGALSAEPQYRDIKPMILAEKLLPSPEGQSSLVDYKLWCFSGEPHSFFVCSNRKENGYQAQFGCYDLDWTSRPERMVLTSHFSAEDKPLPRPECLQRMLEVGRILSKPFPQVRVDLYEAEGQVWFGELTFTCLGGLTDFFTDDYMNEMGQCFEVKQQTGRL